MKKFFNTASAALFAATLAFVACNSAEQAGRDTIPLVKQLLADHDGHCYELLSSFDASSSSGNVVIADTRERAEFIAGKYMGCDYFDNINAKEVPDLLPDFAGEQFVTMYVSPAADEASLREQGVKLLLEALDSSFNGKALVVNVPSLQYYGVFDADTLMRSIGVSVPVIYPLAGIAASADGPVGVIKDPSTPDEVYSGIFGDDVVVFANDEDYEGTPLRHFLEHCSDMDTKAVRTLVLDDYRYTPEELMSDWQSLLEEGTSESIALRQCAASGLRIIDTREAAARECYRLFRERNIFTHNIAYPQLRKDV